MKLFLASKHLQLPDKLIELVGKDTSKINAKLIVNAFDNYSDEKRKYHITHLTETLDKTNIKFASIDLRKFNKDNNQLAKEFEGTDLLWISGGNVFYLRYILKESGLDKLVSQLIQNGMTYAGDSAGAAILGPDLHGLDLLDNPNEPPELIYNGLGITNFIILPHWGNERYAKDIASSKAILEKHNDKVIAISDSQACIVNGQDIQILG